MSAPTSGTAAFGFGHPSPARLTVTSTVGDGLQPGTFAGVTFVGELIVRSVPAGAAPLAFALSLGVQEIELAIPNIGVQFTFSVAWQVQNFGFALPVKTVIKGFPGE